MVLADLSLHSGLNKEHFPQKRQKISQFIVQTIDCGGFLFVCLFCRDRESHDTCNQPGHVHVLGDVSLVCNGNYGELKNITTCHRVEIHTGVCFIGLFVFIQEAYSVARQFNLIPPVCEQAEYHFFQRDKVETQLPELYHKIGEFVQTLPATIHVGGFVLHADAQC